MWLDRRRRTVPALTGEYQAQDMVATRVPSLESLVSLDRRRRDSIPVPPVLEELLLFVRCLTSQPQASASQGRICSGRCACCHTEIEAAGPTCYLTQSRYTDSGPTSPSADLMMPGRVVPVFRSRVSLLGLGYRRKNVSILSRYFLAVSIFSNDISANFKYLSSWWMLQLKAPKTCLHRDRNKI